MGIMTPNGDNVEASQLVRIEFHDAPHSLVGESARIFWNMADAQHFSSVEAISALAELRALVSDASSGFSQTSQAAARPEVFVKGSV